MLTFFKILCVLGVKNAENSENMPAFSTIDEAEEKRKNNPEKLQQKPGNSCHKNPFNLKIILFSLIFNVLYYVINSCMLS